MYILKQTNKQKASTLPLGAFQLHCTQHHLDVDETLIRHNIMIRLGE